MEGVRFFSLKYSCIIWPAVSVTWNMIPPLQVTPGAKGDAQGVLAINFYDASFPKRMQENTWADRWAQSISLKILMILPISSISDKNEVTI